MSDDSTARPAETLRKAGALMRGRAQAATPWPWRALCDGYGDTSGGQSEEDRRDLLWVRSGPTNRGDIVSTRGLYTDRSPADIYHIASMHPGVALSLAEQFSRAASDHPDCAADDGCEVMDLLVPVARAYLGGDA